MDPVTSIVTALIAGAVAGLQPTVSQAVKDSYAGLKALIKRKYSQVSIDQLEANPQSEARRAVVIEDLQTTDAETDAEVLQQVKELLEAVQKQPPDVIGAIGVDLEDIKGASLTIEDVISTHIGVRAQRVETRDDITIRNVRAGGKGAVPQNRRGSRGTLYCPDLSLHMESLQRRQRRRGLSTIHYARDSTRTVSTPRRRTRGNESRPDELLHHP
jgi:hypothetical protein